MNIVILDKATMGNDTPFQILESVGEITAYETTTHEECIEHIGNADIVILNKVKISDDILSKTGNLKLICVFATGYDNIDIISAKKHGVAVCNVPGYSTDSVALFTIATVLALITHINTYNNFVRSGDYSKSSSANKITPVFHELKGKKWGIIGCGNIGKAVIKVAESFGCEILVNKRTNDPNYRCIDIDTLCKESDIITIHCPLNDTTRNLINADRIALMKNNVILVNEARGAVLNEKDVADAVISGRIGAFGCDVYSSEPMEYTHPFNEIMNMENVILTPHAAWAAYEARERCVKIIFENIESFLNNKKVNRVD